MTSIEQEDKHYAAWISPFKPCFLAGRTVQVSYLPGA